MNKSQNNQQVIDNQLADYTDQILAGNGEDNASLLSSNHELRELQQTVQHLKNSLPKEGLSEAVVHRMRQNILADWKQLEHKNNRSVWDNFISKLKPDEQKWQSQRTRQRQSLFMYLAIIVLALTISVPLLYKPGSVQPAASGQHLNTGIFILLGGLLVLVGLWFFRRKP